MTGDEAIMIDLIDEIAQRLKAHAYPNEAAVREGVVVPILRALGWNTHDPDEVRPEYPNPVGRVDYALLRRGGRPAVLIEVKAVGRSLEGDRQLFGYCFEEGVPLAVLTDGRSWNFYLPAGLGRIDERRIHSLQLAERSAEAAGEVLTRYLAKVRIDDRSAFKAAREDHEHALNSRAAQAALPQAWQALIVERNDLLGELLEDKVEALTGYRPSEEQVLEFLGRFGATGALSAPQDPPAAPERNVQFSKSGNAVNPETDSAQQASSRTVYYRLLGQDCSAPNASRALVEILRVIVARDPGLIPALSDRVVTRGRRHIARSLEEINPNRPDLARGEEIAPGWLVGLTISNRDKMMILAEACAVYDLVMPRDLEIDLPNS